MSKILYIDAGHGGFDDNGNYTTPSSKGKYFDHKKGTFHKGSIFYEGVWNRSFAQEFITVASAAGFHCVPVYHPQQDTSLGNRVELANNTYNVFNKQGTYLSFHSNAFKSTNRGFHLFYHPFSSRGKSIASKIVNPVNELFVDYDSISVNPLREGWMDANKTQIYYVLEATKMPSLLFEFGFFDNFDDAEMLFSEDFQYDLAVRLTDELLEAELF